MAKKIVHEGDIGMDITLQAIKNGAALSLSGASALRIFAKPPSGTVKTWTATVVSAAEGTFRYRTTAASDLDEEGTWILQGRFVLNNLNPGHTTKSALLVESALA